MGRLLEWKLQGENRIAKQLDCTTNIKSTPNNGIHGIHFGLDTTFCMLLACSKEDGKTVAENATNEIIMGALLAFCEFSLLVSQRNHSDLSLKAPDKSLTRFYHKKGIS